jgi:predicted nucleic acid-binding protein
MKKLRIYVDSSVFGGCFDKEFEKGSNGLYEMFEREEAIALISPVVITEIEPAPEHVKKKMLDLVNSEVLEINQEIIALTDLYLKENIVTQKYYNDAMHIAIGTYYKADLLVSWNFKHIVNYRRIHLFNSVNMREGYSVLEIRTPMEVIYEE